MIPIFGVDFTVIIDELGNPWWIAKEVCTILGISKDRDAVSRLDADERGSVVVDTLALFEYHRSRELFSACLHSGFCICMHQHFPVQAAAPISHVVGIKLRTLQASFFNLPFYQGFSRILNSLVSKHEFSARY